jgi:uncharacterized protein YndB with AHSA1/START domain
MVARASSTIAQPDDRTIVITRTFDSPRRLVFKAWTDPRHLAQWWGPPGFSAPLCEMDLRVGGMFRIHLRAPDGVTHPCRGVFREVTEPERIVYAGEAEEGSVGCGAGLPPRAIVTVTFAEHDGKTTVTIHTRLQSAADLEAAVQTGFNAGLAASFERLAEHLLAA